MLKSMCNGELTKIIKRIYIFYIYYIEYYVVFFYSHPVYGRLHMLNIYLKIPSEIESIELKLTAIIVAETL